MDVLGDVRLTGPRRRETENTKSKGDLKHGIDRSNERSDFRYENPYAGAQCVGNNIANVNTYGYKAQRVTFKESIYNTLSAGSGATTTMGGTNPQQIGYGCSVGTIDLDMSTGDLSPRDWLLTAPSREMDSSWWDRTVRISTVWTM